MPSDQLQANVAPAPRPDAAFYITAAVIFVIFLIPKLFQHAGAHTGDLDTGIYSNLAWALTHGEGFTGSVLGRHHLGEHFSPIMLVVAPLYLLWPSAYVLMILQAVAVTLAVVLALRMADVELRRAGVVEAQWGDQAASRARFAACALLIVLFMIYPPLLATLQAQFQPIELGMPMVIGAIMLMHARRDGWLALVTLLLLTTRESAPLSVAGLAIYAAVALRRWKLAIVLLLVAGAWAAISMGVIMPAFRTHGRWAHVRHLGPWEMWDLKGKYLAAMLLGLGPLPFLGRRALAATGAAVPGILLNLAVARHTQLTFVGHYDAQTAPFMMVGAVHGVAWLAPRLRDAGLRPAVLTAAASVALAVGMLVMTEVRTALELMEEYYPIEQRRQFVREARQLAARYADAPAMSAWAFIGPQVCHRPRYMAMRAGGTWPARMEWAADRLLPGTIILVPTDAYDNRGKRERQLLYFGGRAKLVDCTELVEAWQWPLDAPPPRTPEAREYVFAGRRAVEVKMAARAAATQAAAAATQPSSQPSAGRSKPARRKRPPAAPATTRPADDAATRPL